MLIISTIFITITSVHYHSEFELGEEKSTHLRFYFHNVASGPDPTTVQIASAPSSTTSPTRYGVLIMMDEPLTEGPDLDSALVGRAEGLYRSASKEEVALVIAFNIVFVGGEYNGSTLAVVGRNTIYSSEREMAIIGGTGKFRFARGYDRLTTYSFNTTSSYAVVEHNVFIVHR
ncbi:hypothetical protein QJS04_geneDACA010027 [Acorus gramineus]|uniref:Dirigent protein n=1 Tax=Acorus gramineus TaxID=55184 RepID=A0AAV9BFQ8_ACOGR|nr:hypothetical protein QJS04_geneDACA010027 [Acorus gramineus]